ncbi:hypothetical protein WR25_00670 [Diploscapter pachys]|uniref:Uncharacterized protein n=1 Tax=Diploscapter pachys TaxID=2018661 RepID=A0A2A2JIS0_9BILA|nr:hypothetical protein WR25_00670 [Diploscapter pachys]
MEEDGASSSSGANQNIFYHKQFRRKGIYLKTLPLTPTITNPLSERKAIYGKLKGPQIQIDEVPNNSQKDEYEFVDPLGATVEGSVTPPPIIKTNNSKWIEQETDKSDSDKKDKRKSADDSILDNTLEMKPSDNLAIDVEFLDFEPWRKKREKILKTFTTNEKLELSSSFLPTKPVNMRMVDKTKHRLEVLEDMSGLRKLSELSQQEFVNHVNELRELLLTAWTNNKRVEALRLVVELARMLSQTNTPFFYPSQWVLAIDIIDLFGLLVYKRLMAKTNEERKALKQSPLPANFNSEVIPTNTMDVARNWFCKIADIKELIPRFYIETSLIACLRFLDTPAIRVNLMRLATMCTKFQHGLCAAYARAYLCKTAMHLDPSNRGPHWKCLNDWLQGSSNLSSINLTWPALEWIIQCVAYSANSRDDIAPLWEYCRFEQHRDYLLRAFLSAVSSKYLNSYANDALDLVLQLANPTEELITLGKQLLRSETPLDERVNLAK